MAQLPILKNLDNLSLITHACHLYKASIMRVLPLSILLAIFVIYIRVGAQFFSPQWKHYFLQSAMLVAVILLPLGAMIFKTIENVGKEKHSTYLEIFIVGCQKFISLFGTFISMILFPLIVLGLGIAVYFMLLKFHLPSTILILWKALLFVIVFACFVPKLFAPILVVTDNQDANSALDLSSFLVKNYYLRTFTQGLSAVLLIVLLAKLPALYPLIKGVAVLQLKLILEGISGVLLALIGPWSFALLLVNQSELQWRKREKTTQNKNQSHAQPQIKKVTTNKPDDVSF